MIQYTYSTSASPDVAAFQKALAAVDPSDLLDLDASGQNIRISTLATQPELLACLHEAGAADPSRHLAQLASDCCGGCGG